jgi:hypothetical protein
MGNVISTLPNPGTQANWGSASSPGLNFQLTALDNVFDPAGAGTSVGLNIGSGKTISLAGTASLSGTASFASGSITTFASGSTLTLGGTINLNVGMNVAASTKLTYTTAGALATVAPNIILYKSNPSANSDFIGQVTFDGNNASSAEKTYSAITSQIISNTAAAESGALIFQNAKAGALTTAFQIGPNGEVGVGSSGNYGTSGQILQSQGPGSAALWSTAASGSNYFMKTFTSPGTWSATAPSIKAVKVTVVGGGGAAYSVGGGGGAVILTVNAPYPVISSPVTVTVGVGGVPGTPPTQNPGGTSSFGTIATATGGSSSGAGGLGSSPLPSIPFAGGSGFGIPIPGGPSNPVYYIAGNSLLPPYGGGAPNPSGAIPGLAGIVIVEEFY